MRVDELGQIEPGEVAGHDEGRPRRIERIRVAVGDGRRVEAAHGLVRSAQRAAVRRLGRVDRFREDALGTPPRVGARLEKIVQSLVTEPGDLLLGETRFEDHLGEQSQGGAETRAWDLERGTYRLPAGVGVELRAEPLRSLGERDRVESLRAFGQCARGQHRHPSPVRRFGRGAARQEELRGKERTAREVGVEQSDAVA
jgi:hypothetical protein